VRDLLLAFYGDDLTGSTDVLEVLAISGISCALFLDVPSADDLAPFPDILAVGVAGTTRAMTTAEMDEALPNDLARLADLNAPVLHYKICSTLDSSPMLGSIGRALEHGLAAKQSPFVPVVVAAPRLGRYTVFGNLFARAGSESPIFRLDRHPGMSVHPATPMGEADVRLHLGQQTGLQIGLVDVLDLEHGANSAANALNACVDNGDAVIVFDVLVDAHLATIGTLLGKEESLFVAGSSAVEEALATHWKRSGYGLKNEALPPIHPADPVVVVSGSASPVTARQIGFALEHGFRQIALDTSAMLDPGRMDEMRLDLARNARAIVDAGHSVVVHTALGPADPRIHATQLARQSTPPVETLGRELGFLLREILEDTTVSRIVIIGGDTSTHVARALGIKALEVVCSSAPGAPLCRAHSADPRIDGLEIVVKGGQVGGTRYLPETRDGAAPRPTMVP
jgi:uncharacterized protein YgbK (DUF1537 family)